MLFLSCFLLCFRARLSIDVLWSPAGKELPSWLSFVMSNCEVVTFQLVSWVSRSKRSDAGKALTCSFSSQVLYH